MPARIEDYAVIGDTHTVALVGRDGSIDWLCLPRFDSGACFAALLGDPSHGRWLLAPRGEPAVTRRRYRDGTLVLETEFDTDDGTVRLVDFMPRRGEAPDVVRLVEGVRGRVAMRMELIIRFDYGSIVPWVRRVDGGLWAAATTSLPEAIGGVRNWDYRYCWLRDATFTLYALELGGYEDDARAWREWLLRAAAGHPADLQIMYGPAGERRLTELELPWLPGYEGSRPVRVGNAAVEQFQLDVYGEVMDALYLARRGGADEDEASWALQQALMGFLESAWH